MKYLFFSICLLISVSVFTQEVSIEDIVGVYKEKSSDPMGGSTMVFLPDQTFVIAYFGGIQKGNWELRDQNILISQTAEPQFALYGRKMKGLGNKTQLRFLMDADNDVMVGLDSNNKTLLKPVFNKNANCFIHPYIFTQDEELIQLHAAQVFGETGESISEGKPSAQVFHFNIFGAYNDLILINLQKEYTEKWNAQATFKNGKLYFGSGNEGSKKRPLESLNEEDLEMMKHFATQSLFPNLLQSEHEFFPFIENPTKEQLNPYNRIEVLEITREVVTIEEGSFFTATCSED